MACCAQMYWTSQVGPKANYIIRRKIRFEHAYNMLLTHRLDHRAT